MLQTYFSDINTDNPDLSGARDSGLKVLSYHGLADEFIFVQGSINYFTRAAAAMGGNQELQKFNRLFLIPGLAHDGSFARAGSIDPATGARMCMRGGLVRAAWYERQGPASEVLQVGELPAPRPGPGEVRVRLTCSGVNPGDTKKRRGWLGSTMPFPMVIPHSDGAGVIESVGPGVEPARVGRRAWVFGAQSYRPFGTAAQLTVVPSWQAIDLPDGVSDEVGGVGALAAQLAAWGDATVIGTVRRGGDLPHLNPSALAHAVALDQPDAADAVRTHAPGGVDRIVEVAFSDNVDLDAAVVKNQTVIAAYATHRDRPDFPFWPMLFSNSNHPSAGQRRLSGRGQAAGSSRPHHRRPRRGVVDRDRHPTAARRHSRGSRPRRRWFPRSRSAENPPLSSSIAHLYAIVGIYQRVKTLEPSSQDIWIFRILTC